MGTHRNNSESPVLLSVHLLLHNYSFVHEHLPCLLPFTVRYTTQLFQCGFLAAIKRKTHQNFKNLKAWK
jgi:hypothetical protein